MAIGFNSLEDKSFYTHEFTENTEWITEVIGDRIKVLVNAPCGNSPGLKMQTGIELSIDEAMALSKSLRRLALGQVIYEAHEKYNAAKMLEAAEARGE